MVSSIVSIFASVLGYFAASKADALIGKWIACLVIAWEQRATDASKAEYGKAMAEIKANLPANAAAWESWRRRASEIPTPEIKPLVK